MVSETAKPSSSETLPEEWGLGVSENTNSGDVSDGLVIGILLGTFVPIA